MMSDCEPLATNHEHIWLQPLCCIDERCWCEHPQPCDEPGCELPAVKYVRVDLVAGHKELLEATKLSLKRLSELNRDDEAGMRLVLANAIAKAEGRAP